MSYCTCVLGKMDGWTKQGEDWVHAVCRKPSRGWTEKIIIPRIISETQNRS